MKVIVIGGGPAGMIAAIFAARGGGDVTLIEKNEKLGKKLYITGKGRCNITNACDTQDLFSSIISNPKFMYSGFYSFSNYDIMTFFEELGLKLKVERGDRVFPVSDKSSDVISALIKELNRLGVSILLNREVAKITTKEDNIVGVEIKNSNRQVIKCDKAIVATGGISYSITGSTGDGYRFAKNMGHDVSRTYPSLVPFNIKETHIFKELQGLSLRNIEIRISLKDSERDKAKTPDKGNLASKDKSKDKEIYKEFGELLFTHFGVSGPVILSASTYCTRYLPKHELLLKIDLKPALTYEQLDDRILRDFADISNKQFKNSLDKLLPRKLIPVIINLSKIDPDKQINVITKEERQNLVGLIKGFELHIVSTREYKEAIITKGGVDVGDINPSTMESKLVSGLYFAGEVLDVDALTGGYNLQIAWSTGYLAGSSCVSY